MWDMEYKCRITKFAQELRIRFGNPASRITYQQTFPVKLSVISGINYCMAMSFRYITVVCFFFVCPVVVCAQQFGGNPPSIKWMQISTDTARIIFPAPMDKQAQQVAAIV